MIVIGHYQLKIISIKPVVFSGSSWGYEYLESMKYVRTVMHFRLLLQFMYFTWFFWWILKLTVYLSYENFLSLILCSFPFFIKKPCIKRLFLLVFRI